MQSPHVFHDGSAIAKQSIETAPHHVIGVTPYIILSSVDLETDKGGMK
jgi:hypothetical protein